MAARGTVSYQAVLEVQAGRDGVVTAVTVRAGDSVAAGDELFRVDNRPSIAVNTEFPFWRPIRVGDTGDDVAMLQQILREAGTYVGDSTGTFDAATDRALRKWQRDNAFSRPDGILEPGDMMFGGWPARVGSIELRIGQHVSEESSGLTLTEVEPSVVTQLTTQDVLRIAEGMTAEVNFDAVGRTERATVNQISAAPVAQADGSELYEALIGPIDLSSIPEGAEARVEVIIEEAQDVITVPVAAVVAGADGSPVVRVVDPSGGVETVGVELGISSGAFVEVRHGLEGNEVVVLTG